MAARSCPSGASPLAKTSSSRSRDQGQVQAGCGRSCTRDKRPLLSEAALEGPRSRWSPMLAIGLCLRVAARTTAAPARRTGTASPQCARFSRKSNSVDSQPPLASNSVTSRKRCDDDPVKIGSCRSRRDPSMTVSPETARCAFAQLHLSLAAVSTIDQMPPARFEYIAAFGVDSVAAHRQTQKVRRSCHGDVVQSKALLHRGLFTVICFARRGPLAAEPR